MLNHLQKMNVGLLLALCLSLAVPAAETDPVLIEEGDIAITVTQFESALEQLTPGQRKTVSESAASLQDFLKKLYINEKMLRDAEQQGLDQLPEVSLMLERARQNMLIRALVEEHRRTKQLDDLATLAEEHYRANRETYKQPERIKIKQLFLAKKNDAARAQIEQILAQLRAGADFDEQAKAHSEDEFAANGGLIDRWFADGDKPQDLLKAAFALNEIGAVTEVLESAAGFHLIQLIERQEAHTLPFESVKEQIMAGLAETYAKFVDLEFINSYNPSEEAKYDQDALNALFERLVVADKPKQETAN